MKRNQFLLLAAAILLLVTGIFLKRNLSAKKSGNNQIKDTDKKIKIIDQRGKEVILPKEINRIVTLPMPAPFLIFAIDGSFQRIVGMHPKSLEAAREGLLITIAPDLESVATDFVKSGFEANVEELLKLEPDVVLQWANRGEEIIKPIEEAGIPVIGLNYGSQQDLEEWMRIFGKLLGKEEKAATLISYHQKILAKLKEKTRGIKSENKPKILYLPYGEQLRTTGKGTYNQLYFEWTGAINTAQDLDGWQTVTFEQILEWNPDIIYLGNFADLTPKELMANSIEGQDWSNIKAVKEKKVYKVPLGIYRWDPPNPESPLMWLWLLDVHHPDLNEIPLRQEVKKFYKTFLNYELNQDQLDKILRCETNNSQLPSCNK